MFFSFFSLPGYCLYRSFSHHPLRINRIQGDFGLHVKTGGCDHHHHHQHHHHDHRLHDHRRHHVQISLVQTNLPFCNKKTESTQWISDTIGRNFEVIRYLDYDEDSDDDDNDEYIVGLYFVFFLKVLS